MSKQDTDNDQPVSIEDEIQSVLDAGDKPEEVVDDVEDEKTESENSEAEEINSEQDRASDLSESEENNKETNDGEGDTNGGEIDELGEPNEDTDATEQEDRLDDSSGDKLEAPEHWAATDRETFNEQTPKAQEWLLKRHKDMEGNMTRKAQELASEKRQYDAIQDSLNPYRQDFAAAGLDDAGAVRQLASWHNALKTGGKDALLQLANTYNIDMTAEPESEYTDPAITAIKQQVSELKTLASRQQATAQQEKQNQISQVIESFQTETDETGKLKHPHFELLNHDITRLFEAGIATSLEDGYNKALSFRPELTVSKPVKSTVSKPDQLAKVRQAKKAATGIKSSGATKQKRAELSLEEEIAANL